MKKTASIVALMLVCVLALSGCGWFDTPTTLGDDYDLTQGSLVKSDVFAKLSEKNAIGTFSGESNGCKYVWVVFGSAVTSPQDVDLGIAVSLSGEKLSVRFFNEGTLGFKPLLSVYLPEKVSTKSYKAVFSDGQVAEASVTGNEKSIVNFSVLNAIGTVDFYPVGENDEIIGGDKVVSDGSQTVKDQYMTDPVPEGKPLPIEPSDDDVDESVTYTCTFLIECRSILNNLDLLDSAKLGILPSDGIIYERHTVTFYKGENVFDVLKRICRNNDIHLEYSWTPMYNSVYVEGINNLYEFDCGNLSGWMYSVNGWYPNYGCSRYRLSQGDVVEWRYTCDLGKDIGGNWLF